MPPHQFIEWLLRDDEFRTAPRTLIVAAHPDDETTGLGSRLPLLRGAVIAHATDGAPRDAREAHTRGFKSCLDYAQTRRRELLAALSLAGIRPGQTQDLGCSEGQAAHNMPLLARQIAGLIREYNPDAIITHPYEGGHPDHDATAFAVHAACGMVGEDCAPPPIVEMTCYHNSPSGIEVGEFLFYKGCEQFTYALTPTDRSIKRRMLDCFRTQREILNVFPIELERFRTAPSYDFTQPPHEGKLFYELHAPGISSTEFCELAGAALDALEIGSRA